MLVDSNCTMTSEIPGYTGHWVQQQSAPVVSNDSGLMGKNAYNNVSVQTGEEFSEFLQDRIALRRVPVAPNMAQSCEKRVGFNFNQNCEPRHEDLTGILGSRIMDSECGPGIYESDYARGHAIEGDSGAYIERERRYCKEDCAGGDGFRKAAGETNLEWVGFKPTAPPIYVSESPSSYHPYGSGASDGSQSGKLKFLCSFGGKFLPRPADGKLRYVRGETHIISVKQNVSWEELEKKTSGICFQPHTIKYQLPGEDLDALISVSSDEDLQNMIEEYHGLERLGGSQRLRIFLIPLCEPESTSCFDTSSIQQTNRDYQYVAAVNSLIDPSPQNNCSGQCPASPANQMGTNLVQNLSFHKNPPTLLHPLENKGCVNVMQPTQFLHEPQNMFRPPYQSPPFSPLPGQQGDSKNVHIQSHKDNSCQGSNESSSSFITLQVQPQPQTSFINSSVYYHPTQRAVNVMNLHHPNLPVDASHSHRPHEVHFHNRSPSSEYVASVVLDQNNNDFDGYLGERPILKERTFHSEKPSSRPEDPMSLFSGSNDPVGSSHGMPHAFSDPQLQQQGGRSIYCSQEGTSPSSPLSFANTQLSSLPVSGALQGISMQPYENTALLNPQAENKIEDIGPTGFESRLDTLDWSLCSESSSRKEPIHGVNNSPNEKYEADTGDVNKPSLTNHDNNNPLIHNLMNRIDAKDPFLHQDGNLFDSISPAIAMECKINMPNINCNPTSTHGVNTSNEDVQVSKVLVPTLSTNSEPSADTQNSLLDENPTCTHGVNASKEGLQVSKVLTPTLDINLEPFADTQNSLWDETASDQLVKGQENARDQWPCLTTMVSSELGSNASLTTEIAGTFPSPKQQSCGDNTLTDLLSVQSSVLISDDPSGLQPAVSQKDMNVQQPMIISSGDPSPAVFDDADLSSNLQKCLTPQLLENPAKDTAHRREVSILNAYCEDEPDLEIEFVGPSGSACENSKLEDILLAQTKPLDRCSEKSQVESVVTVEDMTDNMAPVNRSFTTVVPHVANASGEILSPSPPEPESIIPEFEETKTDDRDKDESISDAMIAEIEAGIYGLQMLMYRLSRMLILKNYESWDLVHMELFIMGNGGEQMLLLRE
ncbi:uncharacterized protein LOC131155543 isoform X2 [Malania oleifera]|uniref:uncharacterized protein LOC131155543 isoform X2 n=1 Tax=Malania oleifera TaxID=397392 RepID=UPI0025ADDBEB|nr:uncharacterized protein LOC131155543 isoform X2 [Malania oleifera]